MPDDLEFQAMDVRGWLASTTPPPVDFDVDRMVRSGRVAVRRRRYAVVTTTAAAILALAAVPVGITWHLLGRDDQPSAFTSQGVSQSATPVPTDNPSSVCTPITLLAPDSLDRKSRVESQVFTAAGIDPTGQYIVGSASNKDGDSTTAVLWTDLSPTIISGQGQGFNLQPVAVNRHGVVVGTGSLRPNSQETFVWTYGNGRLTTLTSPRGYTKATPRAINEAGDVVGIAMDQNSELTVGVHWRVSSPSEPILLDEIDERRVANVSFLSDGTPVAWDRLSGEPFYWSTIGNSRRLPMPGGAMTAVITAMRGTWAIGVARKQRTSPSSLPSPSFPPRTPAEDLKNTVLVRWNLTANTVETLKDGDREITGLPLAQGRVFTVNAQGGVTVTAPYSIALRDNQKLTLLASDGTNPSPIGMSDDGALVVGSATLAAKSGSGLAQPVLWRC